MSAGRAIGGVMSAEPAGPASPASLWSLWSAGFPRHAAFASGRAALAALLRDRGVRRLWLPAYVCEALAEGAAASGAEVAFYGVGFDVSPDVSGLEARLASGEAAVIVDLFGRAFAGAWAPLVARRPDVLWIEDRAQATDTGAAPLGEVVLYSPRKLVGVADGGLLFARTPLPAPAGAAEDSVWTPEDARALDPDGERPGDWFPLFQAREARVTAEPRPATDRTLAALKAIEAAPIIEARTRNWRRLAGALSDYALWPIAEPDFAPLAFPVLTADAAAAQGALAEARVWAPRHWARLPSDPAQFAQARRLADNLLSLPCDQRYGEADMDRMARAVREVVRPYPR